MTQKAVMKTTRRPYYKPRLEQVRLVIDEAVLQQCKTTSGLFPALNQSLCSSWLFHCFTPGS